MTDLITISTVSDATAAPAPPARADQLDKNAFLKLLVAQLRYQNPLSPSDPSEFMAQTAQFTMVEKLEQLAADTATQRQILESTAATQLVGRTVVWRDADGTERSGVATGAVYGSSGATLIVGDERPPLNGIVRVEAAPAPPATEPEPTDPAQEA